MTELHDLLWRWHDICQAECNVERPAEWWKPKPIDEAEFDRAERAFGFPLPEDVKDLYRFSNRGFMPILTNGMSIAPLTQLLKHGTSIPETRDIHAGEEDKWNVPGFLKAVPVTDNWPGIYISAAPEALGAVFIHRPQSHMWLDCGIDNGLLSGTYRLLRARLAQVARRRMGHRAPRDSPPESHSQHSAPQIFARQTWVRTVGPP